MRSSSSTTTSSTSSMGRRCGYLPTCNMDVRLEHVRLVRPDFLTQKMHSGQISNTGNKFNTPTNHEKSFITFNSNNHNSTCRLYLDDLHTSINILCTAFEARLICFGDLRILCIVFFHYMKLLIKFIRSQRSIMSPTSFG